MNSTKRFLLGVLSSLLLAVGFVRAANQIDPLTQSMGSSTATSVMDPIPPCTTACEDTSGSY
jgi:hypothetical protein